jgi:signal peptidase I
MREKLRSGIGLVLISSAVALCFRFFVLEDFRIASNSMQPNLFAGDLVFVSKPHFSLRLPFSTYEVLRFRAPHRSEVVAFSLPDHANETFVKRVIGIAGDKIEIKNGKVLVNGTPYGYEEKGSVWYEVTPETKYSLRWVEEAKDFGPVEVPKDRFFVLGDNREDSVDSRIWGPIPYSCLKGKVALVWLSLNGQKSGTAGLMRWVN